MLSVFASRHCTVQSDTSQFEDIPAVWTYSRSSRLHVWMSKKSGWNHGCDPPSQVPLGKSTHIEIRDVGGTFSVSFNGEVQCTIDDTGHVLHARTDRDVYVSDPWHTDSLSHETVHILLHGSRPHHSSALSHCPFHENPHGHLSSDCAWTRAAYARCAAARARLVILLDAIFTFRLYN